MDTETIIVLVASILALGISVYAAYRSGQPLTLQGVQEIARDSSSLAADLQTVATVAVAASQQLKESGKIDSNEAAFANAVAHINTWYNSVAPDIYLDPKVVANAVEGAYYWLRRAQGEGAAPITDEDLVLDRWQREQRAGGLDPEIPR